MGDQRRHRGRHPDDSVLFAQSQYPALRDAVDHLSWLLSRDYAMRSSLKLVGDRFTLAARQRLAVQRSSAADQDVCSRTNRRIDVRNLSGEVVWIDGFNLLTTIEAALAGGVLLIGRDGCLRDMASMHGNYRKVSETIPALMQIGTAFGKWQIAECVWFLDSPVSNSGRLKKVIEDVASENDWNWSVELDKNPDSTLCCCSQVVISADSFVLDHAKCWVNAAFEILKSTDHFLHALDFRPESHQELI